MLRHIFRVSFRKIFLSSGAIYIRGPPTFYVFSYYVLILVDFRHCFCAFDAHASKFRCAYKILVYFVCAIISRYFENFVQQKLSYAIRDFLLTTWLTGRIKSSFSCKSFDAVENFHAFQSKMTHRFDFPTCTSHNRVMNHLQNDYHPQRLFSKWNIALFISADKNYSPNSSDQLLPASSLKTRSQYPFRENYGTFMTRESPAVQFRNRAPNTFRPLNLDSPSTMRPNLNGSIRHHDCSQRPFIAHPYWFPSRYRWPPGTVCRGIRFELKNGGFRSFSIGLCLIDTLRFYFIAVKLFLVELFSFA